MDPSTPSRPELEEELQRWQKQSEAKIPPGAPHPRIHELPGLAAENEAAASPTIDEEQPRTTPESRPDESPVSPGAPLPGGPVEGVALERLAGEGGFPNGALAATQPDRGPGGSSEDQTTSPSLQSPSATAMNTPSPSQGPTSTLSEEEEAPPTGGPRARPAGPVLGAAGGGAAGAAVGLVAGGLAGPAGTAGMDPAAEDAYWRDNYSSRPYVETNASYDVYAPAYRAGYEGRVRYKSRHFQEAEAALQRDFEQSRGDSPLTWELAKEAARDAWHRVERALPGDADRDGR